MVWVSRCSLVGALPTKVFPQKVKETKMKKIFTFAVVIALCAISLNAEARTVRKFRILRFRPAVTRTASVEYYDASGYTTSDEIVETEKAYIPIWRNGRVVKERVRRTFVPSSQCPNGMCPK